jgi:ribosomal protein S18 acetylase RimI-like enzyme
MAAAPDACVPEIFELSRLRGEDLDPVLDDECVAWRSALSWDFTPSADLVRRFLRIQALSGYALVLGDRVIGYSYYVSEEHKGLIGDLYVVRDYDCVETEHLLLSTVLSGLMSTPGVTRIEAQLMMMKGPFERGLPSGRYGEVFPRQFMLADLTDAVRMHASPGASLWRFEPWSAARQDDMAAVIAAAYQGHVDSRINDQYRSYQGARRFLSNVVQYPGCGQFYAPASTVAIDNDGKVAGVVLCSLVAADTGHITQVCVTPSAQGNGVGYELIRHALLHLKNAGCEKTSLTVTASNSDAIRLYQAIGFRSVRRFAAYVWDGF